MSSLDIFNGKRSQAAMEFLMTYGWAILVVLAAIGALAYFGVMSPSKFLPESCTLQTTSGLSCLDFKITTESVHLLVINSGGRDLLINNMSYGTYCVEDFGIELPDGTSDTFVLTNCSFGVSNQKVKADLVVSYTDAFSGFTKNSVGPLTAKVD